MDRATYEQLDRIEEQQEQILNELDTIKEKLGISESEEEPEETEDNIDF
jgi:hypothetical protein